MREDRRKGFGMLSFHDGIVSNKDTNQLALIRCREAEDSPEVKGRQRQLQREVSRRRMMEAIPRRGCRFRQPDSFHQAGLGRGAVNRASSSANVAA